MRAMVFEGVGRPLRAVERPVARARPRASCCCAVHACGVCRTDLHLLDGEVDDRASRRACSATRSSASVVAPATAERRPRRRVRRAVARLDRAASARYCRSGRENLCPRARFTGRDIDGGLAEYAVADERFCFPIPEGYPDAQAAPLLCAGLIGYRALRMCGDAARLGLYGFGAAAHILAQVARWQGREVYAFTRPGDDAAQAFARELGAVWAGGSDEAPPEPLDAAIIFAPVGALVPLALRAPSRPAGTVVCGGIHMSDIPSFPYSALWEERVAALGRQPDARATARSSSRSPRASRSRRASRTYPLEAANEALADLRAGRFTGAAVIVP